jgi:hypothetical protein
MLTGETRATPMAVPLAVTEHCANPEWGFVRSRDGHRILFARDGYEIVKLDVNGQPPTTLTVCSTRWRAERRRPPPTLMQAC